MFNFLSKSGPRKYFLIRQMRCSLTLILIGQLGLSIALAQVLPTKRILQLRREAEDLYQTKKYPEACSRYREIAEFDTNDANVRTELGLCLQKLHKNDSALLVSRQALKIASRSMITMDSKRWSIPDLRARKSAYFNLDKMGDPMHAPDSGQCETWATYNSCNQSLFVCSDIGHKNTLEGKMHWSVMRVGLTPKLAMFTEVETETQADLPQPEMRDMEATEIDGDFESKKKWINRDSTVTIPLGEVLETKANGYSLAKNSNEQILSECRVLYFDPCGGFVGMACALDEGKNEDQIIITEYYLIPVQ